MSNSAQRLRYLREDGSVIAVFSDVAEWLEYKNHIIDMPWTSNRPSAILPSDEREREEEKAWAKYRQDKEDEKTYEKLLVYAYLNGME